MPSTYYDSCPECDALPSDLEIYETSELIDGAAIIEVICTICGTDWRDYLDISEENE